jgi:hypothetical protein
VFGPKAVSSRGSSGDRPTTTPKRRLRLAKALERHSTDAATASMWSSWNSANPFALFRRFYLLRIRG